VCFGVEVARVEYYINGRSNKRLNATALKRDSHVRPAGRRVIRGVRLLSHPQVKYRNLYA
jgi:hypothetical protein